MEFLKRWLVAGVAMLVLGTAVTVGAQTPAPASGDDEGMEVMTRGPVHEAFAEVVVFDPQPGMVVPGKPPPMIEEIPPDQRPTGDNVAWIPGYWAWDEERKDFIWVSGVWRNLPPGREWVPGYWTAVENGHQWTSGYWQDAATDEVVYLPEPPKSLEAGPSVAASSDEEVWIPGIWVYRQERYAWRGGYWVNGREDWSWTPSNYRWTQRGYVYVDGYWDYPVVNRGVVFAPVYFYPNYIARAGFYYSPYTVISWGVFSHHLFVRPNYCHYYFGDYYDYGYRDRYYASFLYGTRYRGCDPIYGYNRWVHRRDDDWYRRCRRDYDHRRDYPDARPRRTWSDLNDRPERDRQRDDQRIAERLDRVTGSHAEAGGRRFQAVSGEERQRLVSQRNETRKFASERGQREVNAAAKGARNDQVGRSAEPSRERAGRSPVASRRTDTIGNNSGGAPARLERGATAKASPASNEARTRPGTSRLDIANGSDNRGAAGMATQPRETRMIPGQRRENRPSGEANRFSGGGTGMERGTAENIPQGMSRGPSRQAEPRIERSAQQRPEVRNFQPRQAAPVRQAAPARQTAPVRQAAPARQAAPVRQAAPARQAAPMRQTAPPRQAAPAPSRQFRQQAAPQQPQRQQARLQQMAPRQMQRHSAGGGGGGGQRQGRERDR